MTGPSDQQEIIDFLSSPTAYGSGSQVETMETHISVVFLTGDRVFKLKKAVRFPYLDFSTPELRRQACESEVKVNRRTAPDLYIGVAPVLRGANGGLRLGEAGEASPEALDHVVVMRRFGQDSLLDRMADRGLVTQALIRDLAERIAAFHAAAEVTPGFGGAAAMRKVNDDNLSEIAKHTPDVFDPSAVAAVTGRLNRTLDGVAGLLDRRRDDGRVRHCHGDMHLRNICLIDGSPTLFDAIEFNDAIANVDVLYDLAFLLMDLEHRGLRPFANLAFNHYLGVTGDYGGLPALPFFLATRAVVRAHTGAAGASSDEEAQAYLSLALDLLQPAPARLIAVGGLSGTGKTSVAEGLAPPLGAAPGAVVLRSDMIRKRVMGVPPTTRLGEDAYTAAVSRRVFETLHADAATALAAGRVVIADGVYRRPEERAAIETVASSAGVPFSGLWLDAGLAVRVARVEERLGDASDADAAIVRRQEAVDPGRIGWRRIDADGPLQATVGLAREAVATPGAPG